MAILVFEAEAAQRLEAIYQTSDIQAGREVVLRHLAPRPGERVLDVGCGPGFLTRALGEAVGPGGKVLGVDMSQPVLLMAARRCAELPWVELRPGDARELDLPSSSFDALTCIQVLEYIRAVDGAIAELFRLLRPGGRAVIMATDWRTLAWHSMDEARMDRVLGAWAGHAAHPALPRTLGTRLRRVGFLIEAVEVVPILNLGQLEANSYSHEFIELVRDYLVAQGGVEPAEAEAWARELRELGRRQEYFLSLGRVLFLARRPQLPSPAPSGRL
jgi:arsenite methyltransferase